MSDWSIKQTGAYITGFSGGVQVDSANAANTKGANWTQISASSPAIESQGMILYATGTSIVVVNALIDIAFGGAGSEAVFLSGYFVNNPYAIAVPWTTFIPVAVPPSTRISAKVQSTRASTWSAWLGVGFIIKGGLLSVPQLRGIDTYGAATADSGGTALDPGGSAGTWGNYVELSSSLPRSYKAVIINLGSTNNSTQAAHTYYIDLALGAAGSEWNIISSMDGYYANSTTGAVYSNRLGQALPIFLPKGSRLSARSKSTITDATDRLTDIVVYCLY